MWIKKLVLSLILFSLSVISLQASCYKEWTDAYDDAYEELATDLLYCQNSSWPSRCSYEANLSFGVAVDAAGEEYYNCINRY